MGILRVFLIATAALYSYFILYSIVIFLCFICVSGMFLCERSRPTVLWIEEMKWLYRWKCGQFVSGAIYLVFCCFWLDGHKEYTWRVCCCLFFSALYVHKYHIICSQTPRPLASDSHLPCGLVPDTCSHSLSGPSSIRQRLFRVLREQHYLLVGTEASDVRVAQCDASVQDV